MGYPTRKGTRWLPLLVMLAVLSLGILPGRAAITPAGTSIGNQASATYTDAAGNTHSVTSNIVTTIVQQVASLTLTANNNVTASAPPIQAITRAAAVTKGGKSMVQVTSLNPCAANDALTSVAVAPADGFFTPAKFRGAFSATNNWLAGWTAVAAYGMTDTTMNAADPDAALKMTASTSFPTVAGVVYTVESSTDMKNWSPIGTVIGDGTTLSVTDLKDFDSAKFYRAIRQ